MKSWVRLWLDLPTDPKWRVIAAKSGRPIAEVISVYVVMLANAGANDTRTQTNANERGELHGWSDEDVAAIIGVQADDVTSIRAAMQGKVLDGDRLTGWGKRQPNREDGSTERAKAWRERKRTQANAKKRSDTDTDTDTDDKSKMAPTALRPRFSPPTIAEVTEYATGRGTAGEASGFVDYFTSRGWKVGRGGSPMVDWRAAFRTWERNARNFSGAQAPSRLPTDEELAASYGVKLP